ncbi:MAG: hypothetical protein C0631_14910 [Sedimenticola sp.]|nr:MAG: hypothetical protein C0631_14910 [Sedimenticola sp.]
MTDIHTLVLRFKELLEQARAEQGQWISVTLPVAGIPVHSLPQIADERYFWARPDREDYWLGLGSAWQCNASGESHLLDLADAAQTFCAELRHIDPQGCALAPRFTLASERRQGRLNLPSVQFQQNQGLTRLTVTPDPQQPQLWPDLLERGLKALTTPGKPLPGPPQLTQLQQTPDATVWLSLADKAVNELAHNRLSKLVLTRQVRLQAQRELSTAHLIQTLLYQQSGCTIFALDREDGCWLGASPEILLDQQRDQVFSEAVAGTIRRDPWESVDNKLGQWLLHDRKNQHEHQLVVDSLREGLSPLCSQLEINPQPTLLKLRGLQHLYTPIRGTLKQAQHPLCIAQRLHPSPAICGYPRDDAQPWLDRHEPLDRRLFTGLTGWIDTAGDAALNVVLRCACIRQNQVDLFAGAGLVADSNSLAEWEETELKLDNTAKALQEA